MYHKTNVMTKSRFNLIKINMQNHLTESLRCIEQLKAETEGTNKEEEYDELYQRLYKVYAEILMLRYPKKAVDKKRELERDKLYI